MKKGHQSPRMENWSQDHPERYSNFRGVFIQFQGHGTWPLTC